jgi:hypothetical protein
MINYTIVEIIDVMKSLFNRAVDGFTLSVVFILINSVLNGLYLL